MQYQIVILVFLTVCSIFAQAKSSNNGTTHKGISRSSRNRHHTKPNPDYPLWSLIIRFLTITTPLINPFIAILYIFAPALDLICLLRAFLSHDRWELYVYRITNGVLISTCSNFEKKVFSRTLITIHKIRKKSNPSLTRIARFWFVINVLQHKKGSFKECSIHFAPLPGS